MTILAVGVAGYAFSQAFAESVRMDFVDGLMRDRPWPTIGHLAGGGVALLVGAFQFNATLRNRLPAVHRWMGRVYVTAVAISGVSALLLAYRSFGGPVTHFGFGLLASAWLITTTMGVIRIRAGQVALHRQWMIRSYSLTLAAVTLRIYLPISQIAGIPFDDAYLAISWLCWVPNILFADWVILRKR